MCIASNSGIPNGRLLTNAVTLCKTSLLRYMRFILRITVASIGCAITSLFVKRKNNPTILRPGMKPFTFAYYIALFNVKPLFSKFRSSSGESSTSEMKKCKIGSHYNFCTLTLPNCPSHRQLSIALLLSRTQGSSIILSPPQTV